MVGQSHWLAVNVSGQAQLVAVDGQVRPVDGLHSKVEEHVSPYVLYVTNKNN